MIFAWLGIAAGLFAFNIYLDWENIFRRDTWLISLGIAFSCAVAWPLYTFMHIYWLLKDMYDEKRS